MHMKKFSELVKYEAAARERRRRIKKLASKLSMAEVGRRFGISRERVRQIVSAK